MTQRRTQHRPRLRNRLKNPISPLLLHLPLPLHPLYPLINHYLQLLLLPLTNHPLPAHLHLRTPTLPTTPPHLPQNLPLYLLLLPLLLPPHLLPHILVAAQFLHLLFSGARIGQLVGAGFLS